MIEESNFTTQTGDIISHKFPFNSKTLSVVEKGKENNYLHLIEYPKCPLGDVYYKICYELIKRKFEKREVPNVKITFNDESWLYPDDRFGRVVDKVEFNFTFKDVHYEGFIIDYWGLTVGKKDKMIALYKDERIVYHHFAGRDWNTEKDSFFNGTQNLENSSYVTYSNGSIKNELIPYDYLSTRDGRSMRTIIQLNLPTILNESDVINEFKQYVVKVYEYIMSF
jgi:hypothetical protein